MTEDVREQLLEASSATKKAFNSYRREADPEDHFNSADGQPSTGDKNQDEGEMSFVIVIMQPILRFLQLLCENHNRDLQVGQTELHTQLILLISISVDHTFLALIRGCDILSMHAFAFGSSLQALVRSLIVFIPMPDPLIISVICMRVQARLLGWFLWHIFIYRHMKRKLPTIFLVFLCSLSRLLFFCASLFYWAWKGWFSVTELLRPRGQCQKKCSWRTLLRLEHYANLRLMPADVLLDN